MENLIINILIGLIAIVGFFFYWKKNSDVFKEGGILNNWFKNIKESKKETSIEKKDSDNENK